MTRSSKWHLGSLLLVAALLLTAGRASAQTGCFGDCNNNGQLSAADIGKINSTILRCGPCPGGIPGGVATGCATLVGGCPAADFGAAPDNCLRASELARANQNILKYQPSGCAPTPTVVAEPTPTITPGGGGAKCGDGVVTPPETCDGGGYCVGGTNANNLCTADAQCPGGGSCKPYAVPGCAVNCTTEKSLTYVFSGAICSPGGTKPAGSLCSFQASCVGGTAPGHPCTSNSVCGVGGNCVSECGVGGGCFGAGECTVAGTGGTAGADCLTNGAVAATQCVGGSSPGKVCNLACVGGPTPGKVCSVAADCAGGTCVTADCTGGGSCVSPCGVGGVCLNKSRSTLIALGLPLDIGPLIGQSIVRYGAANPDGTVPLATHLGDTIFNPIQVPGLACACVRGGSDIPANGPGNAGSGILNCGAGTIANDVTLAQDHNTSKPFICLAGTNNGLPCTPKCAVGTGTTRPGRPCVTTGTNAAECPSTGAAATKRCNDSDCIGGGGACNVGNGPGQCTGGTNAGRACYDNTQCIGGGKCSGKCILGPNLNATCSCPNPTDRGCDNSTQCGDATGYCRVTGGGGGFCMGPPTFCIGGPTPDKACFNTAECGTGGTCSAGTNTFLKYCDSNDDCPGSLCNSIDDNSCSIVDPSPPLGSGASACKETRTVCTSGPNLGLPCTANSGCGSGGICGNTCNASGNHPEACNGPAHITLSGANGKGNALILNSLALGVIQDGGDCALAAVCIGGAGDLITRCVVNSDCTGGTCATAVCAGTCPAPGLEPCSVSADCPAAGTCTPGANFKQPCSSSATCGGSTCTPVSVFSSLASLKFGAGKGIDGLPCTSDDAPGAQGVARTLPQTTTLSASFVGDVGSVGGSMLTQLACIPYSQTAPCVTIARGSKFDCDSLMSANPSAAGLRLATSFPALDGNPYGDAVVTTLLTAR